jgi:hypothetical protein
VAVAAALGTGVLGVNGFLIHFPRRGLVLPIRES